MPSAGYGSIPPANGDGSSESVVTGRTSRWTGIIAFLSIVVVVVFVGTTFMKDGEDTQSGEDSEIATLLGHDKDPDAQHWPDHLVSQVMFNTPRPTNTAEAMDLGWEKSGEPCVPSLGEPWLYGGERGSNTSATLYFTPQVEDIPGALSGIEVDYYDYIETNLVGTYFSEQRTSKDGSYHSLAVALRNSATQDLCDSVTPGKVNGEKYIAISPDLVNKLLPVTSTSSELTSDWKEGSCIPTMGYHWWQDTEGGATLSYKAENTVPIVPMYNSVDGTINGLFFLATAKKQNWADTCNIFKPTPECIGALNFWDPGPGLSEANKGRFYICSNLCGNSEFTGSGSSPGMYTTMHWFFMDTKTEVCEGSDKGPAPYCKSHSYPTMID